MTPPALWIAATGGRLAAIIHDMRLPKLLSGAVWVWEGGKVPEEVKA